MTKQTLKWEFEDSVTKQGRASIANWEFTVRFKCEEQASLFACLMIKEKIFNISFYSESNEDYCVDVDCSWADNLKTLYKNLKKVDFKGI